MHIEVETAALIAQVYPVLLLALIVDGRARRRPRQPHAFRVVVLQVIRIVASFGALTSVLLCLLVVANDGPIAGLELLVDGIATVTMVALFAGLLAVISSFLDQESDTLWRPSRDD